jgi:nitrogenase-stabilizing/protective protein
MFDFDDELEIELSELEGAEDFLSYFDVPFDQAVVHVNRLHILQRYHDYIEAEDHPPADEAARKALYGELLTKAYQDFVVSDARTEKVLQIYKSQAQAAKPTFVPLGQLVK